MTFDPAPYEAAMWQQVNAVDQAAARVREAEAALAEARDAAARAMHDYGAARVLAELPQVDLAAVRELYWRRPNLHVAPIAEGFGIRAPSMVHEVAGPGDLTAPCVDRCGRELVLASRAAPPRVCDECQSRRDAEHERWRAEQVQRSSEYEDSIRARFRAGETVDEVYAAYAEQWEANGPLPMMRRIALEVLAEETGRRIPT